MLSSAISVLFLLPAVFAQDPANTTAATTNTTSSTTTSTTTPSSNGASTVQIVAPPTVSGTACGTTQQNFNQCVTKVAKDISSCPSTDYTCLCQTYANIAACYNACPDLPEGETYKQQSQQYCSQAKVSPTTSAYAQTALPPAPSPASTTGTTTPVSNTGTRTNSTSAPVATASAFARSSAGLGAELSSGLVGLALGLCALVFA